MANGRSPYLTSVSRPAGRPLLQSPVIRAPANRRAPLRQPILAWVGPSTTTTLLRLVTPRWWSRPYYPLIGRLFADGRPNGRRQRQQAAHSVRQGCGVGACPHYPLADAASQHARTGNSRSNRSALRSASRRHTWPRFAVMSCQVLLCCQSRTVRCYLLSFSAAAVQTQGTVAAALGIALLTPSVRRAFDLAQLAWNAFQVRRVLRGPHCAGLPPVCWFPSASQRSIRSSGWEHDRRQITLRD